MMARRSKKNEGAHQAKLDKERLLLQKLRGGVAENMTLVLRRHFIGELTASDWDKLAEALIRGGVLGGSLRLAQHVGSVLKRHEQTGEPIHKFDLRAHRTAVRIVKEVLSDYERRGVLVVSLTEHGTLTLTEPFTPTQEAHDHANVAYYDPHDYVRSGRAKVDGGIMSF